MNNISFDDKRIANDYAKDRPWLHKSVIERIKSECNINKPFKNGLDVGCGAGLSTFLIFFASLAPTMSKEKLLFVQSAPSAQ